MKKLWLVIPIILLATMIGCGPKGASRDTLDRLGEAKIAAESSEAKAKDLEAKRIKLEGEKTQKEQRVKELKAEIESLQQKK
jgi:predicted polyphosphate/ATP-dependent NAD kinase